MVLICKVGGATLRYDYGKDTYRWETLNMKCTWEKKYHSFPVIHCVHSHRINLTKCTINSHKNIQMFYAILLEKILTWNVKNKGIPRQAEMVPDILDFRHYKGGRSSAKRTGRLYHRRNPWYSFSEAESTSGHMVFSEDTKEKIPSDTNGDRSRDRPTSSAAP